MMDLVGWTIEDALAVLAPLGMEREDRPEPIRRAEVHQNGGGALLTSDGWLIARRQLNLKYARIQSTKMDVATVMIYPTAAPESLPIFAAEWVVVGSRCHAIILDVEFAGEQSILRAEIEPLFAPLGRRWQRVFPPNPDRPAWFADIAQPWAIFSSAKVEEIPLMREAFLSYLRTTVTDVYLPRLRTAAPCGGAEHADVLRYKLHHYEHSPGRKVMVGRFGVEFTERLLGEYHFGPARPPA